MNNTFKQSKISVAVAMALVSLAPTLFAATSQTDDNTSATTAFVGYETDNSNSVGYGNNPLVDNNNDFPRSADHEGTSIGRNDFNQTTGSTQTVTGDSPSATGTTTQTSNILINSSTVTVTDGNGVGISLRSVDTQSHGVVGAFLFQGVSGLGDASTTATSRASSTAQIDLNTLTNSGTVSASTGIGLTATSSATTDAIAIIQAWANNDGIETGEYPTGTYTANADAVSVATSDILTNVITNSGTINSTGTGGYGVRLISTATGRTTTVAISRSAYGEDGSNGDDFVDSSVVNGTARSTFDPNETYYSQVTARVNSNTFSNSGTIVVNDGGGVVLNAIANGSTATSYDLSTAGFAVSQVNSNTITNSGIISADYDGTGDNISDGIGLYAITTGVVDQATFDATVSSNTITNTGRVYGMRDGIRLEATSSDTGVAGDKVITNTINNNYVGWDDDPHTAEGRVVYNQIGVYLNASTVNANTLNNSSLIVSDPGMSLDGTSLTKSDQASFNNRNVNFVAIKFNGQGDDGNTINLNNPAYLAGTILLSAGSGVDSNTTVNLTSGYSHSNVWSIQNDSTYAPTAVTLNGQLPWFVRESAVGVNGETNNTYATLDPSALAARANAAADLSEAANVAIATNMTRDLKAPSQLWMTGSYGNNRYDQRESNPNMDQKTRLYTVAFGYDQTVDNYRVGVMGGYNQSKLTTGSLYSDLYSHSYDNESSGGFASLYGMRDLGMFQLDVGLSAGAQEHDDKRFVNDNLKWWGISYAKSNYRSQWVSPSAKLALPIDLGSDWVVAPNAQVSYTYQRIGSYTEKESNSNASFDSYGIGVVESRLALDLSKNIGGLKAVLTGGYMNRDVKSGNSVDVTMIGHKQEVDSWSQNLDAVFARLSLKYDITDKFAVSAMGSYMKAKHQGSDDGTSGGYGNLSLIYKF